MNLNDDCLYFIFSLLDVKDQISTALVCRRFHALISSLWQRTYNKFSMSKVGITTCEELAVLMESICQTVKTMYLGCLTCENWNVVKLYSYPNVSSLSLLHPQPASDECVLKMTEIFPNLTWFSPNSPDISGRHIEKWRYLEYLDLSQCEKVKFCHFETILEELHLKSVILGIFDDNTWTSALAFQKFCDLQKISVGDEELNWLSDFSLFSNLKELEFLDLANDDLVLKIVQHVAEYKHNDLVELHACVHFPLNILLVRSFKNLKRIELRLRDTSDFTIISKYAPNLREIVITNCKGLKEEDIYLWLNSIHIELITVEDCKCEFRDFKLNVMDIVQCRSIPLHFNFYKNQFASFDMVTLNVVGKNSLVKITSKTLTPNWFCWNQFQFS